MDHLRADREAAGIGFMEACKQLGIGTTTLWRYENGKTKRPDHHLIERMRILYKSPRKNCARQEASDAS